MQCSKCHRDATIFQPYSGLHLCDQHLIADIEAKAKKLIRAQGWLSSGDHIAVLLSGNPRSSALLYFLKKLTAQRRDIRITAIAIAEIGGISEDTSPARHTAKCLDTELFEISLPEFAGFKSENNPGEIPERPSVSLPCVTGSVELGGFAHMHGITKIAEESCLDEVASMILEMIVRGDAEKLIRNHPCQEANLRIWPFIAVSAAEVSRYAELCGFYGKQKHQCLGEPLNKDTINLLNRYTANHPATKYALLNLGKTLAFPWGFTGLIQAYISDRGGKEKSLPDEVVHGTR